MIFKITEHRTGVQESIGVDGIMHMHPQIDDYGTTIIQLLDGTKIHCREPFDEVEDLIAEAKVDHHIMIKAGDTIILEAQGRLHLKAIENITRNLKRVFPKNKIVILEMGMKFKVAKGEDDGI